MNVVLNFCVKLFIRVFMPGIARSLEEEGQFDFRDKAPTSGEPDVALYIDVEDNGSDVTLICFAGMAVLYAAMPKFEFRKTLMTGGDDYNFVWVRDVHRASYNLAPDGSPNGFAFYTRIIGDALERLGSTRNIAVGASGGGMAAFAFSGMLPIDQLIVFNPAFPLDIYSSSENLRTVLADWRKLLRKPSDYFEAFLVTLSTRFLWKRNCRLVGKENIPDTLDCYRRKDPPTQATVFYSTNCPPDTRQAMAINDIPTVTLIPIESGRHNCMRELKQRGELGPFIQQEIGAAESRSIQNTTEAEVLLRAS